MRKRSSASYINKLNPKNLDFFGSEFQLNYTPNGRFQTKAGGFMWIGVVICMIIVAYSSFRSLISNNSPAASVSNLYSREAPRFDLYKEKMFFHLGLRNKGRIFPTRTGMDQINRYVTIKGYIMQTKVNEQTGDIELLNTFDLNYKPCSQVKDRRVMEDLQLHEQSKKFIENLALCPELAGGEDKYVVQGKAQDPPDLRLRILFFPCSLPNPADCATLSEFQGTETVYTQTKKVFDLSNYEEPLTSIPEMDGFQQLDPTFQKEIFYKMRDYEVWDDRKDFFDKRLRVKSAGYLFETKDSGSRNPAQIHCDATGLDNPLQRACTPYLTMIVSSSGEKEVIVRTYSKFFATLGEIGGTAELLFLFIGLIYFQYNAYYLKKYIKSEVLKIESAAGLRRIFTDLKFEKGDRKVYPHGYWFPQNGSHGKNQKVSKKERGDGAFQVLSSPLAKANKKKIHQENRSYSNNEKSSKNVEELIDKQIEKNMSGISLWRSLNHLEILMKIFFRERHKKLLPVVLLNLIKKNSSGKLFNHSTEQEITLEEAYEQITNIQPSTEIEKIMDDFFTEHAPDYFKNQQIAKKPQHTPPYGTKQNDNKMISLQPSVQGELKGGEPTKPVFQKIRIEENDPKSVKDEEHATNNPPPQNFESSYRSSKLMLERSIFHGVNPTQPEKGGGKRNSAFRQLGGGRDPETGMNSIKGQAPHREGKSDFRMAGDKILSSSKRRVMKSRRFSNMKTVQGQQISLLNLDEKK